MLCEYGCGQEAKYQLKNGKYCCENDYRKCIEIRNKISQKLKGRVSNRKGCVMSDSQKLKISIALQGRKVSQKTRKLLSLANKGKKRSKEFRRQVGLRSKKRVGKKNPFFGKQHSEETKTILREKRLGRKVHTQEWKKKLSEEMKGKNNPFFGKKHSEKTKNNLKSSWEKAKRNGERIGENHPMWCGGISNEPYCDIWSDQEYKESIKERDGYICLNPECNKTSTILCIHHIDYNKKQCYPRNLITICNSCNAKANFDREWHEAWYKAIIERRY